MLLQLDINNIALIDKVSIELGEGLNILTGETGAGKSIIIDSINAILGERVSKELIRTGKDKACVEAVFHIDGDYLDGLLENFGIEKEEDGTLIISREFNISGKNTCRINGKMATVSMLKEIGEKIIDVHGQYDNQSLLRPESHILLLDSFGGEKILKLKEQFAVLLTQYRETRNKLKELSGDAGERERRLDLLKYQIDEIKKAKLKPGEEENLNNQRLILANSEKIMGTLTSAYDLLFSGNGQKGSASDCINGAISDLGGISRLGEGYESISKSLEEVSYQLEDIIEKIRNEKDGIEFNPGLLESIEERLDLIYKLKKKYGSSIDEVLEYCREKESELEEIIGSEESIGKLQKELKDLDQKLVELASAIHEERKKAAQVLESQIGEELNDLEMKRASFKVFIDFDDKSDKKYSINGLDRVEFLISPNPGEPLKPLSKIASGGEMSRIMLAIKKILADVDEMPTLIFDEIDIGVSGRAAQKVGEKLSFISGKHQVICVTHLAQIAAMADAHYLIEKHAHEDRTETQVTRLQGTEVKKEIARILGGASISDITLKHAEEMLETARKMK